MAKRHGLGCAGLLLFFLIAVSCGGDGGQGEGEEVAARPSLTYWFIPE